METQSLSLDVEEIVDQTDRRGAMGAFTGGIQGLLGLGTSISSPRHHPKDYDLLIIGTPVWMGRVTPAVRTYLDIYGKHIKKAILFCTYKTTGACSALRDMRKRIKHAKIPAELSFVRPIERPSEMKEIIENFFRVCRIGNEPVYNPE